MKNKLKNIISVCMLIVAAAMFSGCTEVKEILSDFATAVRENKNPEYKSADNELQFLVDAIKRKDAQAIRDKFSPYAQSKIDNMDEKINRLIEEFPEWSDEYEISDTLERWSNHGKITYILTPSYDFESDGKSYRIRIIYYTESDEDESKLGYYSIQIFDRFDDGYSDEVYMHGVDDEPDILLWDYTKG